MKWLVKTDFDYAQSDGDTTNDIFCKVLYNKNLKTLLNICISFKLFLSFPHCAQ